VSGSPSTGLVQSMGYGGLGDWDWGQDSPGPQP